MSSHAVSAIASRTVFLSDCSARRLCLLVSLALVLCGAAQAGPEWYFTPTWASFGAGGGQGRFVVNSWGYTLTTSANWIHVYLNSDPGPGGVAGYTVDPNTTGSSRSATIDLPGSGYGFTVYQDATISSQQGAFVVYHPAGTPAVSAVSVVYNQALLGSGACYIVFNFQPAAIYLMSDDGTQLLGGAAPGTPDTVVQNSLCSVDVGRTTISPDETFDGDNTYITVSPAVNFTPSFSGSESVFLGTQSWQTIGTFASGATRVTLSPSSVPMPPSGIVVVFWLTVTGGGSYALYPGPDYGGWWQAQGPSGWTNGIVSGNDSGQITVATPGAGTIRVNGGPNTTSVVFTITPGIPPATLTPSSATVPSSGVTDHTFFVQTSGCWTATSPSWITVTQGGSGCTQGTVVYSVLANNTGAQRSGSIDLGGTSAHFGISQLAPAPPPPAVDTSYFAIFADNRPYSHTYQCDTSFQDCSGFRGACTVPGSVISATASNPTVASVTITYRAPTGAVAGRYPLDCDYYNSAGQLIGQGHFQSGPEVIGVTVAKVSFGGRGYLQLRRDTTNGAAVDVPAIQWQQAPAPIPYVNYPIAYASGGFGATMTGTVTLLVDPLPDKAISNVRIEGAISNLGRLVVLSGNIPAYSPSQTSAFLPFDFTSNFEFPAGATKYYDAMEVNWSVSSDGTPCNSNCASAKTSSHRVYVTFSTPTLTPYWETAVYLAVSNQGATSLPEVFQKTWAKFAGPGNVTTWYGQKLYYYRNDSTFGPIGFALCAASPEQLLRDYPAYSGQCGAFAKLFLYALAMNGLLVDLGPPYSQYPPNPYAIVKWTQVSTADFSSLLIKDWTFKDLGTYVGDPESNYWYAMTVSSYVDYMVPPLPGGDYGDLVSLNTIPSQNTSPPSEKMFDLHFIVKDLSNGALYPGHGPYFDPSYGLSYLDAADLEAKLIDGYAKVDIINFPGDLTKWRVLNLHVFGPQSNIRLDQ